MNAVKELIENSLDAGADRISIIVQVPSNSSSTETSAGLFSIQVTDNGSGIDKEDLGLLCERHATSKLEKVDDLRSVGTFGFRGEALASCAQVARVEVITRSRNDYGEVAWKASYIGGKLVGEPTPLAGNYGTTVNVKDLFYANRVRREGLLNSSEEYQKIVQVIQSYALNQSRKCAFSLSRRRDRLEIQSNLGEGVEELVKKFWTDELGGALLPFEINREGNLGIEGESGGWASRTTFHKLKSAIVMIFLNGRLIDHAVLRRSILQAFAAHLPTSPPAFPFIYLRLNLKGNRVDVNVHPSKRQVFFLDEGEVIGKVIEGLDTQILRKQYETQSFKPILINKEKDKVVDCGGVRKVTSHEKFNEDGRMSRSVIPKISCLYPSQRVLTDSTNHRIDRFLYHAQTPQAESKPLKSLETINSGSGWSPLGRVNVTQKTLERAHLNSTVQKTENHISCQESETMVNSLNSSNSIQTTNSQSSVQSVQSQSSIITLDSENMSSESVILSPLLPLTDETATATIIEISKSSVIDGNSNSIIDDRITRMDEKSNAQLSKLLKDSLVVGLVDSKWALLQSGTNLVLCDMHRLNYELFYSLLMNLNFKTGREEKFQLDFRVEEAFEAEIRVEAVGVFREQTEFLREECGILLSFDSGRNDDNNNNFYNTNDDNYNVNNTYNYNDNTNISTDHSNNVNDNTNIPTDHLILKALPVVLNGQKCPQSKHIKIFLQRLCLVPDYSRTAVEKEETVEEVLKELGMLYGTIDDGDGKDVDDDWEQYLKHVVLPGYRDSRARFTMNDGFKMEKQISDVADIIDNNKNMINPPLQIITNTETLYKSFERC